MIDFIRRTSPLLVAGLFVVAGIISFAAQTLIFPSNIAPEDWEQAASYIVDEIEAGDIVRVHPTWNEDALPYLKRVGNQVHRHHKPLAEDIQGAQRVWVLSESKRLSQAFERLPFEAAPLQTRDFDKITVALFDVPATTQFPYELRDQLAEAVVSRVRDGKAEACTIWDRANSEWHCGKRDRWIHVARSVRELDDDPRRCIYAHPAPDGQTVRVDFNDVPLEDTLRIRAGLDLRGARSARGTPIHYRVLLDDEIVARRTIGARESTWPADDIDTSAKRGTPGRVTMEVDAHPVHERFFCFNGWTIRHPN